MRRYLIVGNGVAGVTAAQGIARADPGAEVHVFGAEPYPYYQRPRLWMFLAGQVEQQDLYFRPLEWYASRGIEVHLDAPVSALDPGEHRIQLASGEDWSYDRLLLATGGRPFVPPFKGVDQEGVFVLRTLRDALAIQSYADQADRILIVGGGLLGLETAKALLAPGRHVSVLEIAPHLLPRQLDVTGAQVLQTRLETMGLHIETAAVTESILGNGRVQGVRLQDGSVIGGDLVLLSTGIRSQTELARSGGLEVGRGIVVDEHLQTSAPDVYAAGDAAEYSGAVYGIIPAAIEQAQSAGANMVSAESATYTSTVPATTLKIVGIDLTCLGESTADGEETLILRYSDQVKGVYKRLALRDNRIVGAILLGGTRDARALQTLIATGQDVSAYGSRLLDGDLDLVTLTQ
ncbi:MAG: NAD(P)/FAD-dependent oxidoreductase [Ardenticatenia bacterium]|nr:NAD(P)/FAD-dependent oxidoreductase [Ardenticatenia bacterium]